MLSLGGQMNLCPLVMPPLATILNFVLWLWPRKLWQWSEAQDMFLVIYLLQVDLKVPEPDRGWASLCNFDDIPTSPVWDGSLSTPLWIPNRTNKNFKPGSITHYNLSENKINHLDPGKSYHPPLKMIIQKLWKSNICDISVIYLFQLNIYLLWYLSLCQTHKSFKCCDLKIYAVGVVIQWTLHHLLLNMNKISPP